MTCEQDRQDLARHQVEIEAHESFNYAVFDAAESALLGCVYIDPPERVGADAEIAWWVVDSLVGTDLEEALDGFVPRAETAAGVVTARQPVVVTGASYRRTGPQ